MKKIIPFLYLFLSCLLLFCFNTQAQSYNIAKTQAFFRTSTAGNVQVDENGRPTNKGITKDYLIYIETKGSIQPKWETAYIDGLPYTIRTVEVQQTPVNLGPLKGQKTDVTIRKGANNQLWQLVLTPQHNAGESIQTAKAKAITLSGTFRNKSINYRITKVQELEKRFNQ
jgi:hypothetical protein